MAVSHLKNVSHITKSPKAAILENGGSFDIWNLFYPERYLCDFTRYLWEGLALKYMFVLRDIFLTKALGNSTCHITLSFIYVAIIGWITLIDQPFAIISFVAAICRR